MLKVVHDTETVNLDPPTDESLCAA